jgi:preprotein translocase subunit SecA
MITKLLAKIVGDPSEKAIKKTHPKLKEIKAFEKEYEGFDEVAVKTKTVSFQERLKNGETTDDLLAEAFALVMQACKLLNGQTFDMRGQELAWNMVPYDVQLVGGIIMHSGKIAEMKTGEGKTLVATLPLYLNALAGKGAFLVTVNDYLASRDAEWMGFLYNFLGLSVGVISHGQSAAEKKAAYACDITYGTNNEFGFDYLRDNMSIDLENCVQRELNYAIIDEVDSILIDESRTPLIISAPAEESTEKYKKYSQLVPQLKVEEHYTVDEKSRSSILTDEGVAHMEGLLGMENIYTEAGAGEVHHIEQALKAYAIFKKDIDYIIQEGQVVIIDEFTGRLMAGRRYSDGLHQAIEAKEGVAIKRESKTLATITFQNYFRLYNKLAGMTGTAVTEAEEFGSIYGLETVVIPTNKPIQRQDNNDLIYKSVFGKFQAVAKKVRELQEKGQPVLVGTISVEKSELLSKLFKQEGVKHEVLNAKHHEREAEIVADAGQKGAVTIATNMAGRGTDIKINDEVKDLGGLYIIGTERHDSRRIDNQLRGRSGRQGDPGFSQFYVSMEDELMRLFGGDRMKGIMETLKVPEDMPIENGLISRSIESAQKKVEGRNFDIRKHLVEYDDVMNKHRGIVYRRRREVLENENMHEKVSELLSNTGRGMAQAAIVSKRREEWNINQLIDDIHGMSGIPKASYMNDVRALDDPQALETTVENIFLQNFNDKRKKLGDDDIFYKVEKQVYLRTIDRLWMEHIDSMMKLRQQVSFRGYAQKDPLVEYKNDGFAMFEKLIGNVQTNTAQTLLKMDIKPQVPREQIRNVRTNEEEITDIQTGDREMIPTHKTRSGRPTIISADDTSDHDKKTLPHIYNSVSTSSAPSNVVRVNADDDNNSVTVKQVNPEPQQNVPKTGRNDDCPCASGKKYKKCHGK